MTDLNSLNVASVVLILGICLLFIVLVSISVVFGFWLYNTHGLTQLCVYLGIWVFIFIATIIATR